MSIGLYGGSVCGEGGAGPEGYVESLGRPHARPMDFTGKPMKGMVYVAAEGLKGAGLKGWVMRGVRYARSVPAKRPSKRAAKRSVRR
jgi:hypothetical protein